MIRYREISQFQLSVLIFSLIYRLQVIGEKVPVYKFKRDDAVEDSSCYTFVNDEHILSTAGATLRC